MTSPAAEAAAIGLIGDGVVGALIPARHARRWEVGPSWWKRLMHPFAARPQLTRVLAVAELAAGLWVALRRR